MCDFVIHPLSVCERLLSVACRSSNQRAEDVAAEQLAQDAAKAEYVCLVVVASRAENLGGHVHVRPSLACQVLLLPDLWFVSPAGGPLSS